MCFYWKEAVRAGIVLDTLSVLALTNHAMYAIEPQGHEFVTGAFEIERRSQS